MHKIMIASILLMVILVACTIQLEQTSQGSAATAQPSLPAVSTPMPVPDDASAGATPTLDSPSGGVVSASDLSGRLIINHIEDGILELDLATGGIRNLFTPEPGSLLTAVSASPDGARLAFAYSPPPADGGVQLGFTSLYVMPLDGSAPAEPYLSAGDDEGYFTPAWSSDGYIYYGHYRGSEQSESSSGFTMERAIYPQESGESLLVDALWPDLSSDGSQMAFILVNRTTFIDELFIADSDGSNPLPLLAEGSFQAVDSPHFSPDGTQVLFSAVPLAEESGSSWWDEIFGLKVARAHAVPSDMWVVSAAGGQPEQITDLFVVGITGDYSPDGAYIAYVSVDGLFVMNADGTGTIQLMADTSLNTLQWIP